MKIWVDGSLKEVAYVREDGNEKIYPVTAYPERVRQMTNNQAEYLAIIVALEDAKWAGIRGVDILSDSQLVVRQISGEYKITKQHLKLLWDKILYLASDFDFVNIMWIPREDNRAGWLLEGRRTK